MIFKTIESDATKSGEAITFLDKKISDIWDDFKNKKGVINSLFKSENFGLSDKQVGILNDWNNAIDKGTLSIEEQTKIIKDADEATQKYFKGLDGGEATLDGLAKATGKVSVGAKAAALGVKALKLALNTLISIGITYAINFIISKLDEFVNAVKNGVEKINNLDSEIKSLNSEIKDLNDKLSDTKIKINELEKLPKLTFLQKEELETLKAYNDELERQRRERENEERSKQQEKSKEAENVFNNLFGSAMGAVMSRESAVQLNYSIYKTLLNDYEKLKNEINKIKESNDYQSDPDKFENTIRQKENELRELDKKISEQYTNWQTIATNLNPYNDYTDKAVEITQSLIDKWDALSGKVKTTLTDILNDSQFAVVKQYLDDLAAKGELTVEKFNSLTENEVTGIDRFREALKNVKDLTVEDVVESINQEIKDSAKEADNTANSIQNLAATFDKLYDSIDDVLSKQEKLAEAFKKTRLGAKLTIQELYDLIKEMPSLAKYASKDGDGYTISAEGFEKVSKENDNTIKEQLAKDLENIRNQLILLDQEEELLAEKERLTQQLATTNGQAKDILVSQLDEVTEKYEDVANQCQYITDTAEDLAEAEKGLIILNDLVGASFDETKLAVEGINETFDNAKSEISDYNSSIQTIDNAIKKLKDSSLLTYDEMNALVDISPKLQDSFKEQENGYSIVIEALEELREESYETRNAYIDDLIAETKAEIESAETTKETYENRIKTINGLSEGVIAANAQYLSYLKDNIEDLDEKIQAGQDTINKLEGLRGNITSDSDDDDLSDKLQNQIDYYKTILSAVDAVKNKYSEAIDKEISALEDGKTALRDSNDERQRELDLIEARNNLENAKKRKIWVYSEGKGFQQVTNEKAVKEAEEEYRNVITDIQEAEIDKRIEALEDQKEQLEENTKALTDLESEIEDAKNIAQAVNALGLNDESELLTLSDESIEEIRNGLAEATLQKDIEDNKKNDDYTVISMDEFLQSLGAKVNAEEAAQILVGNNKSVYNAAVQGFKDALNEQANNAVSSVVNNGANVTNYNTFEIYDATDPNKVAKIVNQEMTTLFTKIGNSIK